MEWSYLQRVVPGACEAFAPVEEAITTKFLPALIGSEVSSTVRAIMGFPVRLAGLGLPSPVLQSHHFDTSVAMTEAVSRSLVKGEDLDTGKYCREAGKTLAEARRERATLLEDQLATFVAAARPEVKRRVRKNQLNGAG